jgi:hypothetical protein
MPTAYSAWVDDTSLMKPQQLVLPAAWGAHIPFAFWLVSVLRPRVVVELGTRAGVPAAEAAARFAEGAVDLLHVDALQVGAEVSTLLATWLPKLSTHGVVVVHGVSRMRQAWQELARRHPAFDFPDGDGLGVLLVGGGVPQPLRALAEPGNAELAHAREAFRVLADAFQSGNAASRAPQPGHADLERLQRENAALAAELAAARAELDTCAQTWSELVEAMSDSARMVRAATQSH